MLYEQREVDLAFLTGMGAQGGVQALDDRCPIGRFGHEAASTQQLYELLEYLDVRADTGASRCFWHLHGATARAVANIKDWMAYLPESCVRAMVGDGWHWST